MRDFFLVFSPVVADVAYQEITAPETKLLQEKEDEVLLVEVLSQLEFELHHLTGVVNIPVDKLGNSSMLPADKNCSLFFFIVWEVKWPYSEEAARFAVR